MYTFVTLIQCKLCYVINNNHNKNKNTFSPILLPDSNHLNKELINIYISFTKIRTNTIYII